MKLNVAQIQGLVANGYNVTIPSNTVLDFREGSHISHPATATSHLLLPYGTTAEWDEMHRDNRIVDYQLFYDTTLNEPRIYAGGGFGSSIGTGSNVAQIGTQENPALNGTQIYDAGLGSGNYWIQPEGESAPYEMYVDNTRNGGGWVLCASVRTSTCQDHMTRSAVRISGSTGPRTGDTSTTKMADSWINNLVASSGYVGSTRYWMEATGFNKSVFIDSGAWVNLNDSASDQNARTRISNSYEGSLSDRGPNTGTRGFGDHHTSGGTYFAWGRHPESGNNCGFREDSLGASNGYLWVK